MFEWIPPRPDEPAERSWTLPLTEPAASRPGLAFTLVAYGVAADLLVRNGPGIGFPLAAAIGLGVLLVAARPRPEAFPYLGAALLLTVFAAIRTSPVLHALDLVAAAGLAAVGASYSREGEPLRAGTRSYAERGLILFAVVPGAAGLFLRPLVSSWRRIERFRRLPRTLLLLVPVVGVFLILFATADPVFAHLLRTPFTTASLGPLASHAPIAGACAALAAVLVNYAGTRVPDPPLRARSWFRLAPAEWVPILACVSALFAAFVAVQFSTLFGGNRHVLEEAGLTYASYARSGFGQMVIAAALTLLLIAVVWDRGGRESGTQELTFALLAGSLVLQSLVVLVSAFRRLALYEETYGFTWTRLLVHAFILWLAAVLACTLGAIALRRGGWVVGAAVALGLVALVGVNALDPEALIARRNIARFETTGKIDVRYLSTLSADAAPALLEALPSLPEPDRTLLAGDLACERQELGRSGPWPTWSLDLARARRALAAADLGECVPLW